VDGVPMAVVRGLEWVGEGRASDLIRDSASDLFRT
jgi:F420-0:gamma-glutamyl ligase